MNTERYSSRDLAELEESRSSEIEVGNRVRVNDTPWSGEPDRTPPNIGKFGGVVSAPTLTHAGWFALVRFDDGTEAEHTPAQLDVHSAPSPEFRNAVESAFDPSTRISENVTRVRIARSGHPDGDLDALLCDRHLSDVAFFYRGPGRVDLETGKRGRCERCEEARRDTERLRSLREEN